MNKLTTIMGITLLVAALAVPVFAWGPNWGRGHHMMGFEGRGPGYDGSYDRGYETITPDQRTQLEQLDRKFYDETSDLRNRIWTKSAELDAILNSTNPDIDKARAIQKEINDLRANLDEKRNNYVLEARKINPETRFSYGHGMGYGRHMRGYGPGACWN